MSSTLIRVISLLLVAASLPTYAGRVAGPGRLVEWIPFNQDELTVSAAVGRSINTVVIYNPDRLEQLDPQMLQFVMRRQDFVAFFAAELLRGNRQFSKPWGTLDFPDGSSNSSLPFSPIREEQVYAHDALRRTQERGLDCLAFQSLDARGRLALRDFVQKAQTREDQSSLLILPTSRKLSAREMVFYESETCLMLARTVRQ